MYSGYFSVILKYSGLEGLTFGLCILDNRDATTTPSFGTATIRFYIPTIHSKIPETGFKAYLRRFNPIDECQCRLCRGFSERRSNSTEADYVRQIDDQFLNNRGEIMKMSMEHFLTHRFHEIDFVNNNSFRTMTEFLEKEKTAARRYCVPPLSLENYPEKILSAIS